MPLIMLLHLSVLLEKVRQGFLERNKKGGERMQGRQRARNREDDSLVMSCFPHGAGLEVQHQGEIADYMKGKQ